MRSRTFWIAFAIGVATGAGIALLCAPQSGAKTRRRIRQGVEDAGDYLVDAREYLKTKAEFLSAEANVLLGRTRKQINQAAATTESAVDSAVKVVQSLVA